ncbi:MAG: alpha/beta fold hydrolase [Myxococcales bacterium]|nr:alpha/beta fold hydrolase [Myxococcales bacterium]
MPARPIGSWLLVIATSLAGCHLEPPARADDVETHARAPELTEFECGDDLPARARCGDLARSEDPDAPAGRTLALRWIVLPATDAAARVPDPVFVLAGGPGQAATQLLILADTQLAGVNATRDIVFVDQRGTGASNGLRCLSPELGDMLVGITDPSQRATLDACRAKWDADLGRYNTTLAMADLDALREALGYGQINLWGVSYGTRAALEYLRRHEASVRSALLWGVVAPGTNFLGEFAAATERAYAATMADCAREPACRARVPEGAALLETLAARLEAAPATVEVVDERSGQLVDVHLDRDLFVNSVRLVLYDAGWAAALPAMLAQARDGDYTALMTFASRFAIAVYAQIYNGMYLAVVCSEDVPFLTAAERERAASSVFGDAILTELTEACAGWPRAALPADWSEPVRADVPVLLMNGAVDPATPLSAAEAVARTLSDARVVGFANVAHGTSNATACVNATVRAFLDRPEPADLDVGCAAETKRPPWLLE